MWTKEIEAGKKLISDTWDQANKLHERVESGKKRLTTFSLLDRIFKYNRFKKIRSIINQRESTRLTLVLTAIGMVKKLKRIERNIKRASNNRNA